jgi:lipopolysaccharide export LptBFGC system permease protein LptF
MLFQSSLRKELARSFGATLVVLTTIILTIVLIRTLGLAAKGQANPQDVVLLMAYATLGRLPTILSLSLFIAILSTLSRMYRDSEMVVWLSSGRSLASFVRPVMRFSWPVLLVIAASALWLWPWTSKPRNCEAATSSAAIWTGWPRASFRNRPMDCGFFSSTVTLRTPVVTISSSPPGTRNRAR